MIEYNYDDLDFQLQVNIVGGEILYDITVDTYADDSSLITGELRLFDRDIRVTYDGYDIDLLVNLSVVSHEETHTVHVEVVDPDMLLEELTDILEDYQE